MTTALAIIGLSLAMAQAPQTAAQTDETEPQEAAPPSNVIIVAAESEAEKKQVIVGSRIPRKPVLKPGAVATNTGTPGLVPGSGMDPMGRFTRTIITRECKSDNAAVTTAACRALVSADKALAAGDTGEALFWLRHIADGASDYSPAERLIGAQRIFAIGRDQNDVDLRQEAYGKMLETGELAQREQLSVARSSAAIAMEQGEEQFAGLMLEQVIAIDPTDAQSLANLAILQRGAADPAATATMQQAIAAREAKGRTVSKGWRDFIAAKTN